MGQNLTGQTIASTYEDLVQISGSSRNFLTDGTGSDITSLNITASFANTATSASHAVTASFALNATVNTGSLLTTASISDATTTYTKGDGSTFNLTVNNVQNASTASIATSASFALTASYALNAAPGAAPGLVSGSAPNTLRNADFLVTTPASAAATGSIALGNAASVPAGEDNGIAIGNGALARFQTVTIGNNASGSGVQEVVIGANADTSNYGTAIGWSAVSRFGVAVGRGATAGTLSGINGGVVIGSGASGISQESIVLGNNASATLTKAVAIGTDARATGSVDFVIRVNDDNLILSRTGSNAIEVPGGITASLFGTATSASYVASAILTGSVSSNVLTFTKFDGSTFNLTVNTGSGGGGTGEPSGLISGSAPSSLISANYQPTASIATGTGSIAIGNNVRVDSTNLFALGTNITASAGSNTNTVVIGATNTLQGNCSDNVLIGNNLNAQNGKNQTVYIGSQPGNEFVNQESVAIGYNAGAAAGTVAIGWGASGGNEAVNIGKNSNLGAQGSVTVGATATSLGNNAVTLGYGAANSAGNGAITIGTGQTTSVADEINIGGKFRFNSGSNGIIELRDDVKISGSITATLSSSVQSNVVYYNSTTGLFTYGAGGGGSTPSLQEVTTVGSSTSASISITDGGTFTVDNQTGAALLTVTSDGSNTYSSTLRLGGGGGGGNAFFVEMLPGDIAQLYSDGGVIRLNNNTEVTGSLTTTGAVTVNNNPLTINSSYASITDGTTGNNLIGATSVALNSIDNSTPLYVNFTDNNGFDTSGLSFNPANFELDIYTYNNARIRLDGPTQVTGSLRGEVNALTITSNTASLDCATGNFFTLQLVPGANTHINPSNILPGQTINLRVNTTGSGTVSFPTSVKQASGSAYVPTTSTGVDIVTFIAFDSSNLYLSNVKNLI